MNATSAAWLETPTGVARLFADWHWDFVWQSEGHSVVYRLRRAAERDLFLKLVPVGHYPSISGEAARLRWAAPHVSVPAVVRVGVDEGIDWMATSSSSGKDGTDPSHLAQPERLVRTLARGLRQFHDRTPVADCPFDFRLTAALEHAHRRLAAGLIDPARDLRPESQHMSAAEALACLEATRPSSEDLVVCHGDYCPPNILIENWQPTGFLDLGELGVADRWSDLAVATSAMTWNLGPGYEELFLTEYGVEPDPERIAYYRLLHGVVS